MNNATPLTSALKMTPPLFTRRRIWQTITQGKAEARFLK
jgi:hypothetical protein